MRRLVAIMLAAVVSGSATAADNPQPTLERQRETFRHAHAAAELGDWGPAARSAAILEPYILWPDLRATWLRARLPTVEHREIESFLERFGNLKPGRELRYRYALHLAATGRRSQFLDLYEAFYQGLGVARLDCLAVHARMLEGRREQVAEHALTLWMVGHSQADECDPVFDELRASGRLDEESYRRRYELAIAARQYSLARYLARSLDEAALREAERWLDMHRNPSGFLAAVAGEPDGDALRRRVIAAVERVALTDARRADEYWRALSARYGFSDSERALVSRHIALWYARQHDADALERLSDLPASVADDEVRRWRARAALARRDWPAVVAAIDEMPEAQQIEEEWRFWLGRAHHETGDVEAALDLWQELSAGRSYYGFLAADELGLNYAYAHAASAADDEVMRRLEDNPSLLRARELFFVGLESRGRAEWDDAVALLGPEEKLQAGILAHHWGWHSRAIATVAAVGRFDDLELRYPLAWPELFEVSAATAGIPHGWAYGVARSESLFTPDIRSRAGAIGVMQLMPATGRLTAGELNLPYEGLATLTDPAANIRLGTSYLGKMLRHFGDNRVVATAAYNAGPSRVERWLPRTDPVDARIWIENIPFNETRDYVRRVLVSEAIFDWRLGGATRRLSDSLGMVGPLIEPLADTGSGRNAMACSTASC